MSDLVTVFGGSGFVGTQVVRALAKAGYRVRVAVRKPLLATRLKPMGEVGQIQLVRCDATKDGDVRSALEGAKAAVNLVGILYGSMGRGFDKMHREVAKSIAEAAKANDITRLVQMSALGANGASHSGYARSKGQAEAVVQKLVPTAVILRPSVIFGPEDDFYNRFAKLAGIAPILPLISGGKTRFQPVYVGDVAQAVVEALKPAHAGKTFELGGPSILSFEDILKTVTFEIKKDRPLVPVPFAGLLALGGDLMAAVGLPPILTSDQLKLLKVDNVVAAKALGLKDLGIAPTGPETIVPTYLWRYRKGGQFAEAPQA